MSTVTISNPEAGVAQNTVTPEYMSQLSGIIQEVAAQLNITEPQALSVTGTALKLTNMALSTQQIVTMVTMARQKGLAELTPGERELLFAGSWIVRTSPFEASAGTVGRNAPCPCKSGKKYKNCCLDFARKHDKLRYDHGK